MATRLNPPLRFLWVTHTQTKLDGWAIHNKRPWIQEPSALREIIHGSSAADVPRDTHRLTLKFHGPDDDAPSQTEVGLQMMGMDEKIMLGDV